eukprot:1159179_1
MDLHGFAAFFDGNKWQNESRNCKKNEEKSIHQSKRIIFHLPPIHQGNNAPKCSNEKTPKHQYIECMFMDILKNTISNDIISIIPFNLNMKKRIKIDMFLIWNVFRI